MHAARHPRTGGRATKRAGIPAPAKGVWRLGCLLISGQAVVLIVVSVHLWHRFDLTSDMATFHQAWQQIATGHLDPYLSTFAYHYPSYGYPFWQSHLELIMWPLALLWHISPSSLTLLVAQDLAIAGAGLAALRWGLDLAAASTPPDAAAGGRHRVWVLGGGLLLVLLVNPWTYWTAWYDFHLQPFAVLFAILAGSSLRLGQRRGWLWVLATLLCGDVAATYLIALGASGVAVRSSRRRGLVLMVVAIVWLAIVSLVGSGKGSSLADRYGYLTSGAVGSGLAGIFTVVTGIARHPHPAIHVVAARWREIYKYVAASGTIGALSVVGLPMAVVVLGANALNKSPVFIGATAAFQSEVVVVAGAIGATATLAWLSGGRFGRAGAALAAVLGVAALIQAVATSAHWTPKVRNLLQVPSATAVRLASVEALIPSNAEVVVSQGVIGRFGGHTWVYPFLDAFGDGQTVPIHPGNVAFVFCNSGFESATPAETAAAVAVVTEAGGRLLGSGDGVTALLWTPPSTVRTIHFSR